MMLPPNHPSIVNDNKVLKEHFKAHPEDRDWKKHVTQEEIDKAEAEMLQK
jgi:hypothetical protein